MLFSDEMAVLKERFREVTVTLETHVALPQNLPSAWMRVEIADRVVRFVHADFKGEASVAEVREVFPAAVEVDVEAMTLREIFLAVAKVERDGRRGAMQDSAGRVEA